MVKVTTEDIKHIAKLSRLIINDNEIESYKDKLSNVVDMASKLSDLDTTGINPTTHVIENINVFRKDEVKPSYDREDILKNSASKDAGCISVLKVVE